jgi:hypothetical protein
MKPYHNKLFDRNQRIIIVLLHCILPFSTLWAEPTDMNPNSLKLKIVGNGYSDETNIYFIPEATTGFDPQYDAFKLMGNIAAPQLYSIIDCCKLSTNALPEIYNSMIVQLGFRVGVDTNYSISATGLYTFGSDTLIFMEDTKVNQFIDLKSDSVYTFLGETTDQEERFRIHFFCPMKYDLKVFLEGPFNGSAMNTDLNDKGILPLSQSYNSIPWNYTGTESVASIPNNSIVDWILVELRDAPDAMAAGESTVIGQRACFLMSNGSIRELDGVSIPLFAEVFQDSVFVVIRHRNHLDIMSAYPLVRTGDTFHYDFTGGEEMAYGISAQKEIGSVLYGMYAGDGSADGTINLDDKINTWSQLAGSFGYEQADFNLDGFIDNPDKNDRWYENAGKYSQVP